MDADTRLALAHALRTPLTSLALGLGLLDEGALGPLSEAQREVIRVLVADVARLTALVARDLALDRLGSHAGPIERVAVDVGALVERATAPLDEQANDRAIAFARSIAPDLRAVIDPVKIGWAVATLAGNALRYSPRGGRVELRVAARGAEVSIDVADQGPGMAPDVVERVFDRGGGLGLFLVREIVEAHGGTITVTSAPARGSVFTIRLPIERGE